VERSRVAKIIFPARSTTSRKTSPEPTPFSPPPPDPRDNPTALPNGRGGRDGLECRDRDEPSGAEARAGEPCGDGRHHWRRGPRRHLAPPSPPGPAPAATPRRSGSAAAGHRRRARPRRHPAAGAPAQAEGSPPIPSRGERPRRRPDAAFNSSTRCRARVGRDGRREAAFRASASPACASRFRFLARLRKTTRSMPSASTCASPR
jgi:hypothetical protein